MPCPPGPSTVTGVRYVVFDLSTLIFGVSPEGVTLSLRTADRVLLGSCELQAGQSRSEAVFQLLDDVLDRCVLPGDEPSRVAFYNPFTGDVALGAVPDTISFSAGGPLELAAAGTAATFDGGVLTLESGLCLVPVEPSADRLLAAFAAHPSA